MQISSALPCGCRGLKSGRELIQFLKAVIPQAPFRLHQPRRQARSADTDVEERQSLGGVAADDEEDLPPTEPASPALLREGSLPPAPAGLPQPALAPSLLAQPSTQGASGQKRRRLVSQRDMERQEGGAPAPGEQREQVQERCEQVQQGNAWPAHAAPVLLPVPTAAHMAPPAAPPAGAGAGDCTMGSCQMPSGLEALAARAKQQWTHRVTQALLGGNTQHALGLLLSRCTSPILKVGGWGGACSAAQPTA